MFLKGCDFLSFANYFFKEVKVGSIKQINDYFRKGSMIKAIVILLLLPNMLLAQKIDQLASFRNIDNDNYFRVHFDNDYFAKTDENYTLGYNFELVSNYFKTNPANHLFIRPKTSEFRYGLSVEHIGFTPNHYELPDIQFGDRPFAAAIMLKSFIIATDTVKSSRLLFSFSLGIIGPAALGEEIQVDIHNATGNKTPLGWRHQIKNDIVLNYMLGYEKQLLRYSNLFSLNANSTVKIGTLLTNASVGMNVTFGITNSAFSSIKRKRGFQLYVHAQPNLNIIGYDATLQGGLFNRESPYTISSKNVERFTAKFNYGIVLKTRTIYFEYTRSSLTKEFKTGRTAKWGGIRIGFTL